MEELDQWKCQLNLSAIENLMAQGLVFHSTDPSIKDGYNHRLSNDIVWIIYGTAGTVFKYDCQDKHNYTMCNYIKVEAEH